MSELLEKAEKALSHDLCDHCLGRLFAHVDTGLSDRERGESIRMALQFTRALEDKEPLPPHLKCSVCDEIFEMVPRFADSVVERLQGIEFDTFLIGTRVDPLLAEKEERELQILLGFLPEQLTREEIVAVVDRIVVESGAQGIKDMGRVMKLVMPHVAGRADGKLVNEAVRDRLSAA